MEEGIFVIPTKEVPGGLYWGHAARLRESDKFVRLNDFNGDDYTCKPVSEVASNAIVIPYNRLLHVNNEAHTIPKVGMYVKAKVESIPLGNFKITRVWFNPRYSELMLDIVSVKTGNYATTQCDAAVLSEDQPADQWKLDDAVKWRTTGLIGNVIQRFPGKTSVQFVDDSFSGVLTIADDELERVDIKYMWKLEVNESKPTVVLTGRPSVGKVICKEVPLEAVINFIRKLPD